MFDATQITSEVEAVNLMLSLIGESPVPSLAAATANPDVQNALMLLRADTRRLQTFQWTFNTNLKVTLTPSPSDGRIALDTNCIRAVPHVSDETPQMRDVLMTVRGEGGVMKLYDRTNNTFSWTMPLVLDLTYLYAFENLPEPVRAYLAIAAGRKFQARFDGGETRFKLSAADEAEARLALVDYEIGDGNPNFLSDSGDVVEGWAH